MVEKDRSSSGWDQVVRGERQNQMTGSTSKSSANKVSAIASKVDANYPWVGRSFYEVAGSTRKNGKEATTMLCDWDRARKTVMWN